MGQLLTQAGLAQAVAPIAIIGSTFNIPTDLGQQSWFAAAYSLTAGTFILIAGRLGDMYGYKIMFLFGAVVYGLSALLCGFSAYSATPILYDIFRGLQGIGPASMLPNGVAVLGSVYPNGLRKNMAFSLFGACAPGGFVLGATFTSLFAQFVWWPWAYWVTGIVSALLVAVGWIVIPNDLHKRHLSVGKAEGESGIDTIAVGEDNEPISQQDSIAKDPSKQSFDTVGSLLGVAGLILFNLAWNQAPIVSWSTPYVSITLILGILLLLSFALYESRFARNPILPPTIFHHHENIFTLACVGAGWSSFGIWLLYSWQFLHNFRHLTPLNITAQFSPTAISGAVAALTTGWLLSRIHTSYIMLASMTCFTVGIILVATMPISQPYWAQLFISILVMPWGMDMSFPAGTTILSNNSPPGMQGIAASLVNTVVNYSVSIGLGIAGTVQYYVARSGKTEEEALRAAWYTGIALGGVGMVTSLGFVMLRVKGHGGRGM
ncbi:hypothetical protein HDV00_008064 [Rhizophlyctis rosea]|nr:hypothetical protein HDV00_008064 [Rhizophlyctis rosea]